MSTLDLFARPTEPRKVLPLLNAAMPGRSVVLSDCGRYRYLLTVPLEGSGPPILWVMLNPSSADDVKDDPTLRRCKAFSSRWGAGSLEVVNLAAFRSPHPSALFDDTIEPVGIDCNRHIREAAQRTAEHGGRIVAAWGCAITFDNTAPWFLRSRDQRVLGLLTSIADVYCLGKTANGSPIHPMARGRSRVPDDAVPVLFAARTAAAEAGGAA